MVSPAQEEKEGSIKKKSLRVAKLCLGSTTRTHSTSSAVSVTQKANQFSAVAATKNSLDSAKKTQRHFISKATSAQEKIKNGIKREGRVRNIQQTQTNKQANKQASKQYY